MTEPLVELVDQAGTPIGTSNKLAAHQRPGQLHRAFSVFLVDSAGRILVQRRAVTKYHSGGLWSNTCCGHPGPRQLPAAAASRRLAEELGLEVDPAALVEVGRVTYGVSDSESGLVEREFNHVLVGRALGGPDRNPEEVIEVAFLALEELAPTRLPADEFTAWFPIVLGAAERTLRDSR